ncbi:hypothetical protein EVJ58_g10564 [Rhodofomes roseus]|uniref:Uncharacterized protein n=1 Tax=Rhodofomes roseus TaxID=34475 RepID=A0A4Y9XQ08_9APHY|nr:hypothetical protein EVJ58_g10564 [Rhodofomes roseus]
MCVVHCEGVWHSRWSTGVNGQDVPLREGRPGGCQCEERLAQHHVVRVPVSARRVRSLRRVIPRGDDRDAVADPDVDMDADAQLVQTRDGAQEALGRDPDTVLDEVMADAGVEDEDEYADDESEDEIKEYIHNTCNGVCDIIITDWQCRKQTLPRHGQMWNYYRFYGRVRKWDGLIALVRVHVKDRGLGMYIFRGYLIGGLNSPAAGARMRRTPM